MFICKILKVQIGNWMTITILTLIPIIILRTCHGYYHIKIMCIILSCSCSNNFVSGFKILLDSSKSIFFICFQVTQYQFPIGISFICQLNISYCVWTCVTNWDILNWNIRSETIAIGIIMTWMTFKICYIIWKEYTLNVWQ